MQFKKGVTDRRIPDFEHIEPAPEMDRPSASAEDPRSPFSFTRGASPATSSPAHDGGSATATAPAESLSPSAAPAARVESLIDGAATFDGHFRAEQDLRIQGTVSGDITCRGMLTIERTASARARIDAHDLEVLGTVEGDITCSGRLHLASTAVVSGTIKAGSLIVEEGASINGTVEANYSGEGGVSAPVRRRAPARRPEEESEPLESRAVATGDDIVSRKSRARDLPSFALVSSDEPAGVSRSISPS